MLCKPASIRPSPVLTCSATVLGNNLIHLRPVRFDFHPTTDPYSCRLSRVNRTISISKEVIINAGDRMSPMNNNTLREVSEVMEGSSSEDDKKKMNELLEALRQEKLMEFAAGFGEQKQQVFGVDSFGGFSEKETRKIRYVAECLLREEKKKIRELMDGMTEQEIKNINEVADCLSKDEMKKLRVIAKGLSEKK